MLSAAIAHSAATATSIASSTNPSIGTLGAGSQKKKSRKMSASLECGTCQVSLELAEVYEHAALIHAGSASIWHCRVCAATSETHSQAVAHAFQAAHDVAAIAYQPPPGLFLYLGHLQKASSKRPIETAKEAAIPRIWGKRQRSPTPEEGSKSGARKIGCTNCRRVFTFNSPRDAVRHCMQCFGFRPYCCSVCGHQSPDECRLRSCHLKVQHPRSRDARVQVCGPREALESAIRAHLELAYPFQPSIALSWPGLDPRNKLEEILGVEARILPSARDAEPTADEEEDFASFAEEQMTEEERAEFSRQKERRSRAYIRKPRPIVEVLPSEARKEACLVCHRANHIRAPRDGRPTATAVVRHATFCGGFRPFQCTLCPYSNSLRYEVKCHIKKVHSEEPDANLGLASDLEKLEAGIRAHALRCYPQHSSVISGWRGIRLYEGEGTEGRL